MNSFFIRWLATTLAVAVAVRITGMQSEGWAPLIFMALILGIINAVVRPVIMLLSIPFIVVTLGVFILVVNALLFWAAGGLVPGFEVHGFWNAFFGAIIVSVVNWIFSAFIRSPEGQIQIITRREQLGPAGEKPVQGRVVGDS